LAYPFTNERANLIQAAIKKIDKRIEFFLQKSIILDPKIFI
jgi:hypothetical protein